MTWGEERAAQQTVNNKQVDPSKIKSTCRCTSQNGLIDHTEEAQTEREGDAASHAVTVPFLKYRLSFFLFSIKSAS